MPKPSHKPCKPLFAMLLSLEVLHAADGWHPEPGPQRPIGDETDRAAMTPCVLINDDAVTMTATMIEEAWTLKKSRHAFLQMNETLRSFFLRCGMSADRKLNTLFDFYYKQGHGDLDYGPRICSAFNRTTELIRACGGDVTSRSICVKGKTFERMNPLLLDIILKSETALIEDAGKFLFAICFATQELGIDDKKIKELILSVPRHTVQIYDAAATDEDTWLTAACAPASQMLKLLRGNTDIKEPVVIERFMQHYRHNKRRLALFEKTAFFLTRFEQITGIACVTDGSDHISTHTMWSAGGKFMRLPVCGHGIGFKELVAEQLRLLLKYDPQNYRTGRIDAYRTFPVFPCEVTAALTDSSTPAPSPCHMVLIGKPRDACVRGNNLLTQPVQAFWLMNGKGRLYLCGQCMYPFTCPDDAHGHETFLKTPTGFPVACAGTLRAELGLIRSINNFCDCLQPTKIQFIRCLRRLIKKHLLSIEADITYRDTHETGKLRMIQVQVMDDWFRVRWPWRKSLLRQHTQKKAE